MTVDTVSNTPPPDCTLTYRIFSSVRTISPHKTEKNEPNILIGVKTKKRENNLLPLYDTLYPYTQRTRPRYNTCIVLPTPKVLRHIPRILNLQGPTWTRPPCSSYPVAPYCVLRAEFVLIIHSFPKQPGLIRNTSTLFLPLLTS